MQEWAEQRYISLGNVKNRAAKAKIFKEEIAVAVESVACTQCNINE